jgi:hypothetical protein
LQELRELLELKREMSQMYEQAGPSTGAIPHRNSSLLKFG